MEIISQILLAISPFLVSGLSQLLKPSRELFSNGFRRTVLRFGVALLSFGAITGTAVLAGSEVDMLSIETFVQTALVFVGATGTYFWTKYRNASV